jgi:ElaB/YqjD/DUF883 family membrane-anchored ribosome-binding protein
MAAVNRSVSKKPHATANRRRAQRPTNAGLRNQAQQVTKDLQDLGGAAKGAAQEKLGELREIASEYCEQGRDKVHGIACACEQFLQQRPLTSVLLAAGVGWLLGRFWKRR